MHAATRGGQERGLHHHQRHAGGEYAFNQPEKSRIAGFINATAVVQNFSTATDSHRLAGARGQKSEDDVLLAGMLVDHLQRDGPNCWQQNERRLRREEFWLHSMTPPEGSNAAPSNRGS